jgi:hypothetical protein
MRNRFPVISPSRLRWACGAACDPHCTVYASARCFTSHLTPTSVSAGEGAAALRRGGVAASRRRRAVPPLLTPFPAYLAKLARSFPQLSTLRTPPRACRFFVRSLPLCFDLTAPVLSFVITRLLPGGPAARTGKVGIGDVIEAVNGIRIDGWSEVCGV